MLAVMEPTRRIKSDELPPYSVRRISVDLVAESAGHHHVTDVETWDPDGGRTQWAVDAVIAAMRDGERFIVGGEDRGRTTELGPAVCPRCPMATLSKDSPESSATIT